MRRKNWGAVLPRPDSPNGGNKMKLKTGVDPTSRMNFKNTRGLPFHGMGAFVGTGKTQRAHVYTAASIPVDPEAYKKIDPKKLAVELEVDMCAVNSGRFWMMDELEFVVGEVQNFHGVEYALGRGHDRGRDGLPVPERLRALADPAQLRSGPSRRANPCICCASRTARSGSCRNTPRRSIRA